jgi:hypothetical protein
VSVVVLVCEVEVVPVVSVVVPIPVDHYRIQEIIDERSTALKNLTDVQVIGNSQFLSSNNRPLLPLYCHKMKYHNELKYLILADDK